MMRPRSLARVGYAENDVAGKTIANATIIGVVAIVVICTFYLYYWVGKTVLKGQKF